VSIFLWLQGQFGLLEMTAIILQNRIRQFARFSVTTHAICAQVVLKLRQARLCCGPNLVAVKMDQVFFRVSVHFASENWLLKRRRIKRRDGEYA
jgi:hypothetical protein